MFLQRIKTPGIAHNAYLLGDKEQAILVDPRRDIEEYLKVARENDLIAGMAAVLGVAAAIGSRR